MIFVAHVARIKEEFLWENLTKETIFKILGLYGRVWNGFK
jgi:hypothetical protein